MCQFDAALRQKQASETVNVFCFENTFPDNNEEVFRETTHLN